PDHPIGPRLQSHTPKMSRLPHAGRGLLPSVALQTRLHPGPFHWMTMDDDLDQLVRRADPDRWLASRFVQDPGLRAEVVAVYAFDYELGRAPRVASSPLLGEMRLTWWREALDEIYEGRTVRHHPTAEALAAAVQRHHLAREILETMIDARYRELDASPMTETEALDWARDTAGRAAEAAA